MVTEQVPECRSSLLFSGCMPELKGDKDTVILRNNKIHAKVYADDDMVIVFEKLVENDIKDNSRISREKKCDI